ncbi:MAG: hypothetical protein KF795_15485 [Labilithrix sp.]|nr:hypothetical protein [Labilithrix sp.]
MTRYASNFVQSLAAEEYARLPEFATYEGEADDLQHLKGLLIPTRDVEKVVYVGERENVWVEDAEGNRWRPWMGCWITEYDAAGNVVTKGYGADADPIPYIGPNPMARLELASLGFTDHTIAQALKEHLDQDYEPDRPGGSQKRRDAYKRLMDVFWPDVDG